MLAEKTNRGETKMEKVSLDRERTDTERNEGQQFEIEPSEKQKEFILALGKEVGLEIDVSKLKDRKHASLLIDRLKQLSRQMNRYNDERRSAFGFATKLVFANYSDHGKDPIKYKRFWKDVRLFFEEYTKHQEILMSKEVF
jgi:hypothetical protein